MRPHEQAMKYIGVPFRHRGRSRPTPNYTGAMDCLGLLVVVAWDLDMQVWDQKVYGREPWRDGLRAGLQRHCGNPVTRDMEPDDIVLMKLHVEEEPTHVGLIAPYPPGGLGIVHTSGAFGRVIFHRLDKFRLDQIVEVYPWPAKL